MPLIKLIYFYSDVDQRLVKYIEEHLRMLENFGDIEMWNGKITPGTDINQEIISRVKEAKIIIYFCSVYFFNNVYEKLLSIETESGESLKDWILKKNEEGYIRLVTIPISSITGFDLYTESKLSILPNNRPFNSYSGYTRNEICRKIAESIKKYVNNNEALTQISVVSSKSTADHKPSFLPYLCNRDSQIEELKQVFDNYRIDETQKFQTRQPLICVIHGHSYECPYGFRERFIKRDIYELLKISEKQDIISYDFSLSGDKSIANFEVPLKESFYATSNFENIDNLHKFISQFDTIIINYEFFSGRWNKKLLKSFFDFWDSLLIQKFQTNVIVTLFFSYEEDNDFDNDARIFFNELRGGKDTDYYNIKIAVTPELSSVEKIDVINWLDNPKVFQGYCRRHSPNFCNRGEARRQIDDLYSTSNKKITMRNLYNKLDKLLKNYNCRP